MAFNEGHIALDTLLFSTLRSVTTCPIHAESLGSVIIRNEEFRTC